MYGNGITQERITAFLPANYDTVGVGTDYDGRDYILIAGFDNAGWTMGDYVLPRLASGLWFGTEVE